MTLDSGVGFFDLHDDGGVRPAQQFRQHDAGLRVTVIVGLQAGKDQVEFFVFDSGGKGAGGIGGVQSNESVVFKMDGAVRALRQGFAQNLLGARGTGGDDDHFSAVLFFLAQRFFEREGVRFIDFVRNIFADPGAGLVQLERRIFLRHLLHADQNLHQSPEANVSRVVNERVEHSALEHCQPGSRSPEICIDES